MSTALVGRYILAKERDRIDLRVDPDLRAAMKRGAKMTGYGDTLSTFIRFCVIDKLKTLGIAYPPPEEEPKRRK